MSADVGPPVVLREQAPAVRAKILRIVQPRAAGQHRQAEQQIGQRVARVALIDEGEEARAPARRGTRTAERRTTRRRT